MRVPPEKRQMDNAAVNLLDQTRIHFTDYEAMERIAVFCVLGNEEFSKVDVHKRAQAIQSLMRNDEKLKESTDELKEHLTNTLKTDVTEQYKEGAKTDWLIKEFLYPFKDPRDQSARNFTDQQLDSTELFYCLIDETAQTFKQGMIVSATVIRVYAQNEQMPARIQCRLENGLDANINENDADFFGTVQKGSIVQGRVNSIKIGQSSKDETFSVNLKCKQNDLRRLDMFVGELENNIPEEDLIDQKFSVQEEMAMQTRAKMQIAMRRIQHGRFANITCEKAVENLKREDNGEFYFRPSSRGSNNLTLTWKFFETNIVHIDIQEFDKAVGANIGSRLKISNEYYETLQEIVERYITPCNRSLREVTLHAKFLRCKSMDEMKTHLENEKKQDAAKIPYRVTILDEYPQHLILAYIPKTDVVREFIKVKPRGYFFHQRYLCPFQMLINWFKKNFKNRDYQTLLRRATSPQRIGGGVPRKPDIPQLRPSGPVDGGMEVDQQASGFGRDGNKAAYGRGGATMGGRSNRQPAEADTGNNWGSGGGGDDF